MIMSALKHVHVVDDDPLSRRLLSQILEPAGYQVTCSVDGDEFMEKIDTLPPCCVLLDLEMPRRTGIEILESLGWRSDLKVIVVSGHVNVSTTVRTMKLGVANVIEKPIHRRALLDAVDQSFTVLPGVVAHYDPERASSRLDALSQRERDIIHGLVAGLSNKALAFEMKLSIRTVEMHRSRLMKRLGVRNLSEVLQIALSARPTPLPVAINGGGE